MQPSNGSFSLVLITIFHETKTTRTTSIGRIAYYSGLNENQVRLFLLAMARADETSADVEKKKAYTQNMSKIAEYL